MLRSIVMVIYGVTGITPDRVMTYIIIIASLVIFELAYLVIKKLIIDKLIRKNK